MAMGGFALLLPLLAWWQAAALAATALAFNLLVLPRIAADRLYRPTDAARGLPAGIVLYPLSVLLLILIFPARPDIVAGAWAILAFGDGAATLAGRSFGGPRLPWNREKTVAGSAAFVVAGAVSGSFFVWWCRGAVDPPPSDLFTIAAPLAAAIVAAAAETMPVRLDDNVSVPAAAALTLWSASLISPDAWAAAAPAVGARLPAAAALNGLAAAAGWLARTVSGSGAVGGFAIGVLVYACAGPAGWILLAAAFAGAALTSRLGLERKSLLGIAQEHQGRRGAGNAAANTGLAAAAAVLAALTPFRDAALVAMAAALAAGASDTVASEIGKAWGRRTYLMPWLVPVRPGTSGGVSLEGTAAGIVAAFALAALAAALGLIPASAVWVIVAAATAAAFVEGALAAALEGPGILNNDLLNFLNTAAAAGIALALFPHVA